MVWENGDNIILNKKVRSSSVCNIYNKHRQNAGGENARILAAQQFYLGRMLFIYYFFGQ